jgi:hypothetical protein
MRRDDRLLQLAGHLEIGQLGHDAFDFRVLNRGRVNADGCGTSGCALGECPIAFPNDWAFKLHQRDWDDRLHYPALKERSENDVLPWTAFEDAAAYFGLTTDETDFLFHPFENDEDNNDLNYLLGDATRFDVAARIRAFVAGTEVPPEDSDE